MRIRRATSTDAPAVARLLTSFNAEFDTWSPPMETLERRLAAMLDSDTVLVVVGEDGDPPAPAGFGLVTLRPSPYYDGPVAALDELYVVPDRRGAGIGTAVLDAVLIELRGRGCGELQINVDEDDLGARRFYERHGFTNVEPGTDERMLCYLQEL